MVGNDPVNKIDALGLRANGPKNTCCVNGKEVPKVAFWKANNYPSLRACMTAKWDLLRDGANGVLGGAGAAALGGAVLGTSMGPGLGTAIGGAGGLAGTALAPWYECTVYVCPKK